VKGNMPQEIPAALVTHEAMGTVMTHQAFGERAEESLAAVWREIGRIEGLLSRFLPGSEISRVNESAGIQPERIGPDTCAVLSKALEFSRRCPGCFDVTIEPLVRLWSSSKATGCAPSEDSIRQALALVHDEDLLLDAGDRYPYAATAGLRYAGQAIDLGGIGKGYAGDRILEIYRQFGVLSAYSNLGGNVVTLGAKPDGAAWRVGIQHPRQEGRLIGVVSVVNQSVVTSGDYQRYFIDRQGNRQHHILDPKTGYPADSGLISVTMVTENSLAADALSTITFVAGLERGVEMLKRFSGAEAVLVDSGLRVYITAGLRERFQGAEGSSVSVIL